MMNQKFIDWRGQVGYSIFLESPAEPTAMEVMDDAHERKRKSHHHHHEAYP
jgi:hypothetical protein